MKKWITVFLLGLTVAGIATMPSCFNKESKQEALVAVKNLVSNDLSNFKNYLKDSFLTAVNLKKDTIVLQQKFLQARQLYKQIEWVTEYFMPTTARMVNGPPLPELENEENKTIEPDGLQVIEPMLFFNTEAADITELKRQVTLLVSRASYFENYWNNFEIDSSHIFDAVRLAVFRTITLSITGFDVPLAKTSITETATVFKSLQPIIDCFNNENDAFKVFDKNNLEAIAYLQKNTEFNNFDRMFFIRNYANTISKNIKQITDLLKVQAVTDSRLLKATATTLFDADAFDVNAYVPDEKYYFSNEKALLGKKIFYDNILSSNNKRNCSSCHNPQKAFTDGLATSVAFTNGFIKRNAPTLLNAAYQPSQFYDLRATNLENQTADVIGNKEEMHGNFKEALSKINKDSTYVHLLQKAFPAAKEFTSFHVQNALASYIRTLSSLNSKFDKHMRAEPTADFSADEKAGFNLFMGKAKCGTCHFMPLFNGTVPPAFLKIESEVIGVPNEANGNEIDNDSGRFVIYKLQPYLFAFKTTTVRNAALTGPYMHNGVFKTLEEVVDFYNKGGGQGLGIKLENQTLPFDNLSLNNKEMSDIISFIKTLTDTSGISK